MYNPPATDIDPPDWLEVTRGVAQKFRIFEVNVGKSVGLGGLRITNGYALTDGGGVLNAGNLSISRCMIAWNEAEGSGGGIHSTGPTTILDTHIYLNEAVGLAALGGYGGGVSLLYNDASTAALKYVEIYSNTGRSGGGIAYRDDRVHGGVLQPLSRLTVENSKIFGNEARGDVLGAGGGGVLINGGSAGFTVCEIKSNTALKGDGGGLEQSGVSTVTFGSVAVVGNRALAGKGGGLYVHLGKFSIDRLSSLKENTAAAGFNGGGFRPHPALTKVENDLPEGNQSIDPDPEL